MPTPVEVLDDALRRVEGAIGKALLVVRKQATVPHESLKPAVVRDMFGILCDAEKQFRDIDRQMAGLPLAAGPAYRLLIYGELRVEHILDLWSGKNRDALRVALSPEDIREAWECLEHAKAEFRRYEFDRPVSATKIKPTYMIFPSWRKIR